MKTSLYRVFAVAVLLLAGVRLGAVPVILADLQSEQVDLGQEVTLGVIVDWSDAVAGTYTVLWTYTPEDSGYGQVLSHTTIQAGGGNPSYFIGPINISNQGEYSVTITGPDNSVSHPDAIGGVAAITLKGPPGGPGSASARLDANLATVLAALRPLDFNIVGLNAANPSVSFPALGGRAGLVAASLGFETGLAKVHTDEVFVPLGATGSAVTSVAPKDYTGVGNFGGYLETSTGDSGFTDPGLFPTSGAGPGWTGTATLIPGLPVGTHTSDITALAGNNTAVGYYLDTGFVSTPFTILPGGTTINLLPAPSGVTGWRPLAANADGSVIAGINTDPFGGPQAGTCTLAFYGSGQSSQSAQAAGAGTRAAANPVYTVQNIGKFPGSTATYASGISADGTTVSGYYLDSSQQTHPMIWAANVFTDIGAAAPTGSQLGQAYASTADGSTVVGYAPMGTNAFKWTAAGGMQTLPNLTGEATSVAQCISSDGEFIGGASYGANFDGSGIAQIWTATGQTYNFQTMLLVMGVDPAGWTFNQVTAIVPNPDGSYFFAGNGTNNGVAQGFIVELGDPRPKRGGDHAGRLFWHGGRKFQQRGRRQRAHREPRRRVARRGFEHLRRRD